MINIIATLRFNIKAFGLARGLRLPVFIYGHIKMASIGTIQIHCPIKRNLITIGTNHDTVAAPYTVFCNKGIVEVHGKVYINYGTAFVNRGMVVFQGNNLFGNQCDIDIQQRLVLGSNTFFGYKSQVTDTDHHFVVDVTKRRVYRHTVPITIGNFNWFGSNSFIKKGTITPDYLIVASPCSMLSKDYSALPPYTVLAGCPARPVKEGIRRIYNFQNEAAINAFFTQHPDEKFYQLADDANLDKFCKLQ